MIFGEFYLIALLSFAAAFGGLVRRLSGYGGALIMTPLLMWVFPVTFLIPIVMGLEIFGGVSLFSQWKVHREDQFRIKIMLFFSAVCLPIGIWVSGFISILMVKAFTSSIILIFASYLLYKPHFRLKISNLLDGLSGGVSGFLLGTCGIGGPPVALYLNATTLSFSRARSLLSSFVTWVALLGIISASMMGAGLDWLIYFIVGLPTYWVGMKVAEFLLKRHVMPDEALKRLCLLLLIANALFNLFLIVIF